tara:strand:+ start:1578 stop:2897 length:1320 start_codon:yes stop_codon:yes gene_type:complete
MKQASLADITYEHALGLVQLRKEAIDTGDVTPLSPGTLATSFPMRDAGNRLLRSSSEKRAAGFMDTLRGAWKDPAVKATVIGGGLGAVGGLGKTMFDEDDDNYGQNMLMGGVGGAALGGGLGLMANPASRDKIVKYFQQDTDAPPATTGGTPQDRQKQKLDRDITSAVADPDALHEFSGQANQMTPGLFRAGQVGTAAVPALAWNRLRKNNPSIDLPGALRSNLDNIDYSRLTADPTSAASKLLSKQTRPYREYDEMAEAIANMNRIREAGGAKTPKTTGGATEAMVHARDALGKMNKTELLEFARASGMDTSMFYDNYTDDALKNLMLKDFREQATARSPKFLSSLIPGTDAIKSTLSSAYRKPVTRKATGEVAQKVLTKLRYLPKGKLAMLASAGTLAAFIAKLIGGERDGAIAERTHAQNVISGAEARLNAPQGNP